MDNLVEKLKLLNSYRDTGLLPKDIYTMLYELDKAKKQRDKINRSLNYVRKLLKEQHHMYQELKEERDYLMKFVPKGCNTCAHWIDGDETPKDCALGGCSTGWDMWEYGGVIKNENK